MIFLYESITSFSRITLWKIILKLYIMYICTFIDRILSFPSCLLQLIAFSWNGKKKCAKLKDPQLNYFLCMSSVQLRRGINYLHHVSLLIMKINRCKSFKRPLKKRDKLHFHNLIDHGLIKLLRNNRGKLGRIYWWTSCLLHD